MCTSAQLEVAGRPGGGATGHTNMPAIFRNVGASQCYLVGYPDVTIYDVAGKVLAQASGTANRGTFFDSEPAVAPILMQPGTAFAPPHQQLPHGQAFANIEWWDCRGAVASRIAVVLPEGAGVVRGDYAITAGNSPGCGAGTLPPAGVFRGPFAATGIARPPITPPFTVELQIRAPDSVKRGSTLVYFVTLTNASNADYRLTPCPDYVEILGAKQAQVRYQLNCAPVGHIGSGRSVTFEMRLAVPPSMAPGPTVLNWSLLDGRVIFPYRSTPVAITG